MSGSLTSSEAPLGYRDEPDRMDRPICIGGVGTTLFSPGPAEEPAC